MQNWFNIECSTTSKNHLAAYSPGEYFEDDEAYVDIGIRNVKGYEDPITLERGELIKFLTEVHSDIPLIEGTSVISLPCICTEKKCKKRLIFTYHTKHIAKFHIENSEQEEPIFLRKDDIKEFAEQFKS